ncbi:hypothetical protein Rhopal_000672-T1 [Rhodotorula paludigena]|uniref:Uncharacterized protein n=1 Tax=Rhodotorula paludigena TaxID=86838 RepID=A0AAV5GEF4_9BASI|nr:hypothetical protein Rhopal_000672-T1 [Rhodotorula paludigena]
MDDSLRRHVSRSPMSPSPPPPRARSPGPYSSRRSMSPPPRRRFRSPSPVRAYSPPPSRYGSRGESPQEPLPPAPATGPRGFRPITAQASDASPGGSANAIPTGPRNRYPGLAGRSGVPPRGPSGKGGAPPTGPSSMSAIPTGPKAWRSGQTSIAPPAASSRGGGSAHPRDEWDAQPALADRAESGTPPLPAELERPPMTAEEVALRAAEVERATAERDAKAQALIAQRKAQEEEQTKLLEARREENLRAREAARAQHEIDARRRRLSRFLPRSAGGILAGVQGVSSESMISPGTSFEAEIIRIRRERLGQMPTYHAQLQASRKVDAALTSALAEVAAARERTKLANGELLPVAATPMGVGASGGY